MTKRVAIVGAGFSGTVLAANLLRQPSPDTPTEIILIERARAMGPGLAYASRDQTYLLNVPAGRLSADSRDPLQFLRFAQETLPESGPEDFLPRSLYGEYLQRVLLLAERDAAPGLRLVRLFGDVTRISRSHDEALFSLDLSGRDAVLANLVVLAVGNAPPSTLPIARSLVDHPAYRADAWSLPRSLGDEHRVVILGNGLTMADVALSLSGDAGRPPHMVSISRRGLLPHTQSTFRPAAHANASAALMQATSIRKLIAVSRRMAHESAKVGGDWREVVTLLRNVGPQIWQGLADVERRRFLRHAQSHWDVHRHRLPPTMATRIEALRRNGDLEVNAGRIVDMQPVGEQIRVSWRSRGTQTLRSVVADLVVNATGPNYAVTQSTEPLLRSMRQSGMISEDSLELGIRTDDQGACVGADGTADERLFYLGPMLRASYWEATAATELRDHAEKLARHLTLMNGAG